MTTIIGNLTADPELRFTPSGLPVANFTVASTPRRFNKQTSSWEDDGEPLYMQCSVWREAAENAAESLRKGQRVIAYGRLRSRSFVDKNEQKRTVVEMDVDNFGPDLTRATAVVTKSGGGQRSSAPQAQAAVADDSPF